MHLYLSSSSPLHSTFSNEEGQVLYKVETPVMSLSARTSTISCVVPSTSGPDSTTSMQDTFALLGQVEHNRFSSSVMRFGGNEFKTKDYFRKEGLGPYGRHRVFTASDGREYKWLLQDSKSKLITNDEAKTLVASFHVKHFGIIGKARPASLEIFPPGEHIVQEILITFIYIEKIRKDKEAAAHSQ
ncbi:hypothetical protein H0H81_005446 [Sphagnurus paluster]|uniref:DUF6593 domain-containing protein n=1 Tax=Sphagnurus paluster TaxID=117069 RepID=A0A9P7FUA6_9AGAR|nr:hypothetical protein H0H81_005446 [Sphagnurus paluster]